MLLRKVTRKVFSIFLFLVKIFDLLNSTSFQERLLCHWRTISIFSKWQTLFSVSCSAALVPSQPKLHRAPVFSLLLWRRSCEAKQLKVFPALPCCCFLTGLRLHKRCGSQSHIQHYTAHTHLTRYKWPAVHCLNSTFS